MCAMNPPEWLTDPLYRNVYLTITTRHMPDVSYEEWLDHWFGRAVVSENYPWFADVPTVIFRPAMAFAYAYRLFANSAKDLETYHDDQVGAGLYLLISDDDISLAHPDTPIEQREACLLTITDLFRDLFAKRCALRLSAYSSEPSTLNCACYMWWENFTHISFPGDPHFERMRDACFRVLEDTLDLPHVAVQEAALHGLGHEVRRDPRALPIIERFLAERADLDPELERYGRAASTGCIQ